MRSEDMNKNFSNDGSSTLSKLKPYCNKSSQKCIDDIFKAMSIGFRNQSMGTNTTESSACVFDISKTISGSTLRESLQTISNAIEEIEKVTKAISENEFYANYTHTFYVDELEKEYQNQANKAIFSPAKKLIKLKSTPEYRQKLREAKEADARDTKNEREKATRELEKLRSKLADLQETKRFYQPLYNRFTYWAREAWNDFYQDVRDEYERFSVDLIGNHMIVFGLDRSWEGTTDKLLGDAKKDYVSKENHRSTEKLIARANEFVSKYGRWGE